MLADLIAAARPREVVCVPAGTHNETLVIDRSLTLVGDPNAVLAGDGDSAIVVTRDVELRIVGLTFRGGEAWAGGALFLAAPARVRIEDCAFEHNAAPPFGGGAIYADGGVLDIRYCRFIGNRAPRGGALFADGNSEFRLFSCLIQGEDGGGGLVYAREAARLMLVHCTVLAEGESSPVCAHGSTTRQPEVVLQNSIIQGNGAPLIAGSEGVYRPRVTAGYSLLSHHIDDSVVLKDTACCVGQADIEKAGGYGLQDGTLGAGLTEGVQLPEPYQDLEPVSDPGLIRCRE